MKKNPLLQVVGILFLTMFLFITYSYSEYKIEVLDFEIKKYNFSNVFAVNKILTVPEVQNSSEVNYQILYSNTADTSLINKRQVDTTSQKILLAGDSMVEGLMHRFSDYCIENGHELIPFIWYSSSTKAFAEKNKLKEFINKYQPSFIILALGSNELFVKDLNNRDEYIKGILRQSDSAKLLWVGPPNWKEDTGINDLILNNLGSDRYFLSKNLKFDRTSDGAHPTRNSSKMWADKIAEWITEESKYPIVLNKPEREYKMKLNAVMMNYAK